MKKYVLIAKPSPRARFFGSRQILRSRVDVEYIAFGEVLFEEHSSSFSSPYLFNGKELDRETNLSYYGARYLDMKTSLWLNVDPLAEKHPDESPYMYCGNNPIIFIDPDGRDRIYSASGRFIKDTGNGNKLLVRIGNNDVSLSKLNYNKKGTAYAVSRVIANEAKTIGYKGYYGVKKMKNDDTVAHTNSQNTVFFNTTQLKNGSGDNFYDMRSTLRHEADPVVGHKGPDANTFGGHALVYMNETKGDEFYKSSPENQSSAIAGFMFRAIKAQAEGDSVLGGMVSDFNKFHEGNYSIDYNFQGQNYSSFTVNDIKNNTSFSKNSEEIYKEIQNLKPNE